MFTAMRTVFGVMTFLNTCFMNAGMDIDLCEDIAPEYVASQEENQASSLRDHVDMKSQDMSNAKRAQLMLKVHTLDNVHLSIKHKALEHFTKGYIKRCKWLDRKHLEEPHKRRFIESGEKKCVKKSADVVPPMMYLIANALCQNIDPESIIDLNPDQFFSEACRENNIISRNCIKEFLKRRSKWVWYTPEDALFCAIKEKNIIVTEQILLNIPDIDVRSSVGDDGESLYKSVKNLVLEDSSYKPFQEMLESFYRDTLPKKRRYNE